MDNQDHDSENNAKVSDSAYSNSCSNSQSRRSHSSKSTNSGSHSSRSSGYGGKPLSKTSSDDSGQPGEKRCKEKEAKQKKLGLLEKTAETEDEVTEVAEHAAVPETITEETDNAAVHMPSPLQAKSDKVVEIVETILPPENASSNEEDQNTELKTAIVPLNLNASLCPFTRPQPFPDPEGGFSCVISMHDGVVVYTTSSLTTTLGFPKDMWIGRSFIDFIHSRDRNTFASHITSGLSYPKNANNGTNLNKTNEVYASPQNAAYTMVCRIRKYRNLTDGFGVKGTSVSFRPFVLKLSFKNVSHNEGKIIYLVIQATPFFSAFKVPNELVSKATPFTIRHAANGNVEYIDPEAVQYLGFLPQDLEGKDALQLYHMDDLPYLRQVYETIVREGGLARSKPYRIMTQNWDFIKVETEWSSFINPWSKKLEFVIGKHCILEGPSNPDVFQAPTAMKPSKTNEEEMKRAQALRDSIVRVMNELLTKPAEVAKQQMTKRCQDLASFMENLLEQNPPKTAENPDQQLHVDIQDPDSYYEPDSEMLGGISPHHEYVDSMSSVETPLSYNQLNYNETLERYFDSHQPYSYEDYNTVNGENILGFKNPNRIPTKETVSTVEQTSMISGSGEISSCETDTFRHGQSSPVLFVGDLPPTRLTECIINKHNEEMEKELMKSHRQSRTSSRGERKKVVKENRRKKKEHLERCNATFHPTSVAINPIDDTEEPHGVKRVSKQVESGSGAHKHHCPPSRRTKKKQQATSSAPKGMPTDTAPTTVAQSQPLQYWQDPSGMNTFIMGVGFPQQQMPLISTMPGMPGWQGMPGMQGVPAMIPMYYQPPSMATPGTSGPDNVMRNTNSIPLQQPLSYMMYGQAVYGSPILYSPVNQQQVYTPHTLQSMHTTPTNQPLGLAYGNYEETCKQTVAAALNHGSKDKWSDKIPLLPSGWDPSPGTSGTSGFSSNKQVKSQTDASKRSKESGSSNISSSNTFSRNGENSDSLGTADMKLCSSGTHSSSDNPGSMSFDPSLYRDGKTKVSGENTVGRVEGESSYSSFYSSFFRTETSGSQDEFSDAKKMYRAMNAKNTYYAPSNSQSTTKEKTDPPWTEQLCVTSELVYKYQIRTRPVDEVLNDDKAKIEALEQSATVNDQLGQLYLDLQLEGVAARLTLEEGITSSSGSSGEETSKAPIETRRKRNFNKLAIFYEEDAPFPPTPVGSPLPPTPVGSPLPPSTATI